MKFLISVFVAGFLGACTSLPTLGGSSPENGVELTLSRSGGSPVIVPATGPLSHERLTAVSREILATDENIQKLGLSPNVIDREMAAIANELREESVNEVDLAIRIARRTSSGIDAGLLKKAEGSLSLLRSMMKTPPPPSIFVSTDIKVIPTDRLIHFVSMSAYNAGTPFWESYTPQSRMRIGRYMFRVSPCNASEQTCSASEQAHCEPILILEEPTKRVLQPQDQCH